jgi:restriction endonuclease S subunit
MKVISVKNTWLNDSDLRLDGSFHLSDGVKTKRLIEKHCPYSTVSLKSEAKELFKGNIHKRVYVDKPENGFMFFTASDLFKSIVDSDKYISKKYSPYLKELELKKDWILITRSGTLGHVVFTNSLHEDKIGTDDLVRIKPAENKILRGYLYAFLSCKYGYQLLTQSGYGGVIKHIEPHHVEDLQIPVLPTETQDLIHKHIIEASTLRAEAQMYLEKAKSFFNEYNNLEGDAIFSVSKTKLNDSWLGRNNRPEISNYEKLTESKGYKTLSQLVKSVYAPPMFKHIYIKKDNGYPFFNGAEISKSRRQTNRFLSLKGVGNINDYIVNKDTLLIYRHGPRNGMLGDVFIVDDFLDKACLSDLVIRVEGIDRKTTYWLYTFFSTSIGRNILHNIAAGSAILFIAPHRLNSIRVPYWNQGIIDENEKLIEKFVTNMYKANEMENKALKRVEKEIESWQN